MRNGQPVLAHATGGLVDTIEHNETGFLFSGQTLKEKEEHFIEVFKEVLKVYFEQPNQWKTVKKQAKKQRFTWAKSIESYYQDLYML